MYIDIYILVNDLRRSLTVKNTPKWEPDWNDSFIEATGCDQTSAMPQNAADEMFN